MCVGIRACVCVCVCVLCLRSQLLEQGASLCAPTALAAVAQLYTAEQVRGGSVVAFGGGAFVSVSVLVIVVSTQVVRSRAGACVWGGVFVVVCICV